MANRRATLTLKLGDKEVRYEAEREAVEAQLEHIVGRLLRDAPAHVQVGLTEVRPPAEDPSIGPGGSEAAEPPSAVSPPAVSPSAVPEGVSEAQRLKQLYKIGDDGRLRLRKLPGRTADTLLLVLYGMLKLQDRRWVHAPGMTNAARASGARFDRADRLLAGYQDLIEGVGKRRGKRYRLTAAGREHCSRLVESLVGPIDKQAEPPPITEDDDSASESGIPEKVASKWDGELLSVSEVARRLGVDEAEVGRLRRAWELLGLPGGDRKRRRYFYPAFQIDDARRQIYPQAREASQLASRQHTSWGIAEWWSVVEPELGRRPVELIGTPEADAVVRAARAKFDRSY